jgi:nitrogen fixation/metabolism regulation signal transduction histidine kinase
MGFRNLKVQVVIRLAILIATVFLFVNLFYSESYLFTKILVGFIIVFQVYYLFYFLDKMNREIVGFLKTIQYEDFSHTYTERHTGTSMDELYKEFNEVIKKYREIRADKEAQYQYLKTIVQHVGIGIITFDKAGEIQIYNAAARNLLGIRQIKNVNQLKAVSQLLIETIKDLRTGGRDLVKIERDGDEIQLAVYAIELSLRGQEFKLISIQNIQSELEEKEMEAWQNLIRVLTHEIMNSVTPISSLAATVETELHQFLSSGDNVNQLTNDEIEDFHMAVNTIHKRSESLIKFVSDFRNMTRVRHPSLHNTKICDVLQHIIALMKKTIDESNIVLEYTVEPKDLMILMDSEQIEQVIINLVKNAIEALNEKDDYEEDKKLTIKAWANPNGGAYILIADNGSGIEEEALKKIFIPFFTTKKHGS